MAIRVVYMQKEEGRKAEEKEQKNRNYEWLGIKSWQKHVKDSYHILRILTEGLFLLKRESWHAMVNEQIQIHCHHILIQKEGLLLHQGFDAIGWVSLRFANWYNKLNLTGWFSNEDKIGMHVTDSEFVFMIVLAWL